MEPRCENCKFWGSDKETNQEYRSCQAVIHDKSNSRMDDSEIAPEADWIDVDERREAITFRKAHPAVAVDGSGFFAALKSRKEFGCVLHQVKE